MSALRLWVEGVGLLGPGLASWASGREVLAGAQAHASAPAVLPPPARLPPAERRRAGAAVKLALAVADEAVAQAQIDPSQLATVFTSSSGEGQNCHALCETLATPSPVVSPIRFTNSVHNAAAGCWHIAVASRASSTSLCAFDGSFCAGLIEAATLMRTSNRPLLLVASDSPYPEPLHSARPLPDHFGAALMLSPVESAQAIASLSISLSSSAEPDRCADASLETLRRAVPAARGLPLLVALAQERGQARAVRSVVLDYLAGLHLQVDVA